MSLNKENTFSQSIQFYIMVLLSFFFEDGFSYKYPTKVDMPLNQETKSIYLSIYLIVKLLFFN